MQNRLFNEEIAAKTIPYDSFKRLINGGNPYQNLKSFLTIPQPNFLDFQNVINEFCSLRMAAYKDDGMIYYSHNPMYRELIGDKKSCFLVVQKGEDYIYLCFRFVSIFNVQFCRLVHYPFSKKRNKENERVLFEDLFGSKAVRQIYVNKQEESYIEHSELVEHKGPAYIDCYFDVKERLEKLNRNRYMHKYSILKALRNKKIQLWHIKDANSYRQVICLFNEWTAYKITEQKETVLYKNMVSTAQKYIVLLNYREKITCYGLHYDGLLLAACLISPVGSQEYVHLMADFNVSKVNKNYLGGTEIESYVVRDIKNIFDYYFTQVLYSTGVSRCYIAGLIPGMKMDGLALQKNIRKTGETLYVKYNNKQGLK